MGCRRRCSGNRQFFKSMHNHGGPAGRALAELAIETIRARNTDLGNMQIGGLQA